MSKYIVNENLREDIKKVINDSVKSLIPALNERFEVRKELEDGDDLVDGIYSSGQVVDLHGQSALFTIVVTIGEDSNAFVEALIGIAGEDCDAMITRVGELEKYEVKDPGDVH